MHYIKILLITLIVSFRSLSTGLFVGRFQPFHLGHVGTIKFALGRVDEIIIVIGSAQKSHEFRNPFTAGERIQMIKASLDADEEIKAKRTLLIPVPDTNIHLLWTHKLDLFVPKYDIVFSNDPLTCLLFRDRGIKAVEPPLYRREELSASEVRSRMATDGDWKRLVTFETAKVIEAIRGIDRIKAIIGRQSNMSH